MTPVTDANGKATVRTSIATGGSLQLAAGNDLTIRQAQVKADGNLIAAAGHDLNVISVLGDSRTVTDQSRQGKTKVVTTTTTQDIDQQALTAGGNLVLSAGHDVNLTACSAVASVMLGRLLLAKRVAQHTSVDIFKDDSSAELAIGSIFCPRREV
nr:hemagglutinin repeat-containing protein [Xanthomonas sontii]